MSTSAQADEPLSRLRAPFPPNQISKLPKPTKAQTDAVKADFKKGTRCTLCGAWHHPDVVHLDYVGHAALTDRLLDTDIGWTWEPLAVNADGLPAFDKNGGLWIKLTIAGVTRLGYGSADGKSGGDAVKEIIGDALRNAAMRFGAALDLWHKGDLHASDEEDAQQEGQARLTPRHEPEVLRIDDGQRNILMTLATQAGLPSPELLRRCGLERDLRDLPADKFTAVRDWLEAKLPKPKPDMAEILDDEIPF